MCNEIKCAIQYTVDLIKNNINRYVQECTEVVPGMYTLEGDTGVNSQTSPVPLPQKLISSRPNPTKKLGENPVPFHARKNDSHSLPLPFFFLCRNLSVTVKI